MTYRPCFSVLFGQCFTLCTKKTFFKKNTTIDAALPQLKRAMRVSEPKKLSIV